MTTLTKLVLGAMGALRPGPVLGDAARCIELPAPERSLAAPLMQALADRRSLREFRTDPLPRQVLANLLWAANGVNRRDAHGRTAPSALGAQEIRVIAALPEGAYAYEPATHSLVLVAEADIRRVTGYQDFVDEAPLDLVYVADHGRMSRVPVTQREGFAWVAGDRAGARPAAGPARAAVADRRLRGPTLTVQSPGGYRPGAT